MASEPPPRDAEAGRGRADERPGRGLWHVEEGQVAEQDTTPRPKGLTGEELDAFVREPVVARLAMLDELGYPYVVPVWFEYDGEAYWVVARESVAYIKHLQRDPRVALSIAEDVGTFRRVQVRGRAEIVEGPATEGRWIEILTRIAVRYRGPEGAHWIERSREFRRYLIRIQPERVLSFRGFR